MGKRVSLVFGLVLSVVMLTWAATPVGVVRSSDSIQLHGVSVNTAGVPSWPVLAGDQIGTGTAPAVISFKDGSRITLDKKTKAKIDENGTFHLMEGTMWFKLASGSTMRLVSAEKSVQAKPGLEGRATTISEPASASAVKSAPRAADVTPPPPVSKYH